MQYLLFCFLQPLLIYSSYVPFNYAEKSNDPDNSVVITMPDVLAVDLPNKIELRSILPIHFFKIETSIYYRNSPLATFNPDINASMTNGIWRIYEIEYRVPFLLSPGGQLNLNFTYEYCLPSKQESKDIKFARENAKDTMKECQTRRTINRVVSASLKHKFVHIMGETDKPIYRPGERIRFRFLALNSRLIQPTTEKLQWPSHRLDIRNYSNPHLVPIHLDEIKRRQSDLYFDTIYLVDNAGNTVQQWYNVSQLTAVSLSFNLLNDATEGDWKIVAKVFEDQKELKVIVKNYVLPRFVANIALPSTISFTDESTSFNVCAAYTNTEPFRGYYDAQLCICSRRTVGKQIIVGKQFENNACEQTPNLKDNSHPCIRFSGKIDPSEMNKDGCVTVNASIAPITKAYKRKYDEELAIIVNVEESDTSLVVTKAASTGFRFIRHKELKIDMSNSYRRGLPIYGDVQLDCSHQVPAKCEANISLTVIEVVNPCGMFSYRSPVYSEKNPTVYKVSLTTNSLGLAKFVLPPMSSTKTLRVEAMANISNRMVNKTNDDLSARETISMTKSINFWPSYSNLAFKVESMAYDKSLPCPGELNLKITANSPLNGKTVYLEYLSRGVLTRRSSVLQADSDGYICVDRDDELGHYKCNNDIEVGDENEISCLQGWTGENCLTPDCSDVNCGLGGLCVAPSKCLCRKGWDGSECDVCVARKGCVHGNCVNGNDCVCNKGYSGYLCDYAQVKYENIDENYSTETSELPKNHRLDTIESYNQSRVRRTIFKHQTLFSIDSTFGPVLSAVIYTYSASDDDASAYELISDYIQLDNLHLCSSPAIEASARDKKFGRRIDNLDRSRTVPGGKVNLNVNLSMSAVSDEKDRNYLNLSCLVRFADTSLKNFESATTSSIDLKTYINMQTGLKYKGYGEPSSTEQAFRAAGINFEHISPFKENIPSRIICPMYSMPMMRGEVLFDNVAEAQDFREKKAAPRLREFFPEVWLFEHVKLNLNTDVSNKNWYYTTQLTAPDTITSWEFTAICFTPEQGIWMPPRLDKETLVVSLPFYVEFTVPVKAKRNEILHLPISIFMSSVTGTESSECFEVSVAVSVNENDWTVIGYPKFETCLCFGAPKATFSLAVKPMRIGQLNITAEAVAVSGSAMCGGNHMPKDPVSISDAVRRYIRIVPEGIPTEKTVGGVICTSKTNMLTTEDMEISIPVKIVDGSLRSYISISGNVLGKALSNLNKLVSLPTGCGEQNMVKVAPSVSVLKYLVASADLNNAETKKLAEAAMQYIADGYKNQLKYRHENGSFSAFGPTDKHGSTWLTAFVFSVFSEAEFVLNSKELEKMQVVRVNMYETLSSAYEFLRSMQREDGCFEEYGKVFHSQMQGSLGSTKDKRINDLLLTSYVISTLSNFPQYLEEAKSQSYRYTTQLARSCLANLLEDSKLDELTSSVLAKVIFAFNESNKNQTNSHGKKIITELQSRMKSVSSRAGDLYWWSDSTDNTADAVETTAYAFLALAGSKSIMELLPIVKWLSGQQKDQGGFYSTQDTVVALKALSIAASELELSKSSVDQSAPDSIVTAQIIPSNANKQASINSINSHISQQFELGYSHPEEAKKIIWTVKHEGRAVCVAVHYSALYNIPDPTEVEEKKDSFFSLAVISKQTSDFTAECTQEKTTICIGLSEQAIKSNLSINTGMIILNIDIPSGWTVSDKDIQGLVEKELSRVEQDDAKCKISAYFSAFTEKEASKLNGRLNLRRCISIPFKQKIFVESASPSVIEAMDYYKPNINSKTSFTLNTCARYWIPDDLSNTFVEETKTTRSHVLETTTLKPSNMCPICDVNMAKDVVNKLNDIICDYKGSIFMLSLQEEDQSKPKNRSGIVYSVAYGTTIASWNSTLVINPECSCDLLVPSVTAKVVIITDPGTFWPGMLSLDVAGLKLISFEEFKSAFTDFAKDHDKVDLLKQKCHKLQGLKLLVKKFEQ